MCDPVLHCNGITGNRLKIVAIINIFQSTYVKSLLPPTTTCVKLFCLQYKTKYFTDVFAIDLKHNSCKSNHEEARKCMPGVPHHVCKADNSLIKTVGVWFVFLCDKESEARNSADDS